MPPEANLVVVKDPYCVPGAPVETQVGQVITLQEVNVLGRSQVEEVSIRIPSAGGVGRRHARIWHENGEWLLEEMSPIYTTRINGRLIRETRAPSRAKLNDRDTLGIGDHHLWFRLGTPWRVWLTPEVAALARSVSEERQFDALPILADALEEAGCDETEVLTHCRTPRLGWRVSWVADLLHRQQIAAVSHR
jgi:pSer/pThr/pTyr-binding forkhead associated (FHA) protein